MADMIEIIGEKARLVADHEAGQRPPLRQVGLGDLLGSIVASMGTSRRATSFFLPPGARYVRMCGPSTGLVVELPPEVRRVTWSPSRMDQEGAYTSYWLAFPYTIHIGLFYTLEGDEAYESGLEEMRVYYRTVPLQSPDDELYVPNLFNVQVDPVLTSNCRACLRGHPEGLENLPLAHQVDTLLNFFWETGFNRDIESNGFERARHLDPRIASLDAWQEATRADPLFPLRIPWESANCTPRQVLDRLIEAREPDGRPVRNAADLADLMYRLREAS